MSFIYLSLQFRQIFIIFTFESHSKTETNTEILQMKDTSGVNPKTKRKDEYEGKGVNHYMCIDMYRKLGEDHRSGLVFTNENSESGGTKTQKKNELLYSSLQSYCSLPLNSFPKYENKKTLRFLNDARRVKILGILVFEINRYPVSLCLGLRTNEDNPRLLF